MSTPIDTSVMPILATRDTISRMASFPRNIFNVSENSTIYKYVDAIIGDSGAGSLKKQLLMARLNQRIDTTYFSDLDRVFGNLASIARTVSESYVVDPSQDLLTSNEWDEVAVKDAWYRARIKDFFAALVLGGTPDGLRKMVKAAIGVDCEIYEMWKFQDHYGEIYGIDDIETISNLVTNPSFEYGTTNWAISVGGTSAALASVTVPTQSVAASAYSTHSLQFTTGTTVTNPAITIDNLLVTANKQYIISLYYYTTNIATLATGNIIITNKNSADSTISTLTASATTFVANVLTRISYTFTTPALTDHLSFTLRLNGTVTTPTKLFYIDSVMLNAGILGGYFDGDHSGYRWTDHTGIDPSVQTSVGNSSSIQASPIDALSRLKVPSRNEIIIYPYKDTISTIEMALIREMTGRVAPVDSIITVKNSGYAVNVPVQTNFAAASSTYFRITSWVTGKDIVELTPADDPNPTHRWLQNGVTVEAPHPVFMETQEFTQYALLDGTPDSAVDSVKYFKQSSDIQGGSGGENGVWTPFTESQFIPEKDFVVYAPNYATADRPFSDWFSMGIGDSSDNYPGGKNGLHPDTAPALTKTGEPYVFPWPSQEQYLYHANLVAQGLGPDSEIRLIYQDVPYIDSQGVSRTRNIPVSGEYRIRLNLDSSRLIGIWKPELAVANVAPVKASTVTSPWYIAPIVIPLASAWWLG